jgi:hypothetical protein
MLIGRRFYSVITLMMCALSWSVQPSLAGGLEDLEPDDLSNGPSYYGYVRDDQGGSTVMRAQVSLKPKNGPVVQVQANVLGAYRTHVSATAKPEEVEVSCSKPGFTFVRMTRRPSSNNHVVEIDCFMKRNR